MNQESLWPKPLGLCITECRYYGGQTDGTAIHIDFAPSTALNHPEDYDDSRYHVRVRWARCLVRRFYFHHHYYKVCDVKILTEDQRGGDPFLTPFTLVESFPLDSPSGRHYKGRNTIFLSLLVLRLSTSTDYRSI